MSYSHKRLKEMAHELLQEMYAVAEPGLDWGLMVKMTNKMDKLFPEGSFRISIHEYNTLTNKDYDEICTRKRKQWGMSKRRFSREFGGTLLYHSPKYRQEEKGDDEDADKA